MVKEYNWETIVDIEPDVFESLPEDGEFKGTVRITVEYFKDDICERCKGEGMHPVPCYSTPPGGSAKTICLACDGTGKRKELK